VICPSTGRVSWTVVGPDLLPVPPIERFLSYLTATERSPNTTRTYAHDLAVFFRFLTERALAWDAVSLDDLAQYIFWLRRPAADVVVLDLESSGRSPDTVNRMLSAVSAFYGHHARAGVAVAERLTTWRRIARRDYKPFLHHITRAVR
jgi:site-specific recombinase XerD